MDETPDQFVARYCPRLRYTVKKKFVDALRQTFGSTLFYQGYQWRIKTTSVGAGWYEVTAKAVT